jgi:hypothetical protein
MDNIMLVQESIHSSRGRLEKCIVIKLDMEKSFDRFRYSVLFAILTRFGFATELLAWIFSCISIPWISPMINGRPKKFFKLSRVLR